MPTVPRFFHPDGDVCTNETQCLRWHTRSTPLVDGEEYSWPVGTEWVDRWGAIHKSPIHSPSPARDYEPPQPTPEDEPAPRASMLREAETLICGDRNNQYGPPTQDFQRTADLLNALGYVRMDAEDVIHDILPSDVALIIAQVKVSRIIHSRHKRDSWVDLAGYAACGYECAEEEAKPGAS